MVAPIIIIGIIAVIGVGVVFTPAGDVIEDLLLQSGLTDPDAYVTGGDESKQLEDDILQGAESGIDELLKVGADLSQETIDATDFENNPIGMTKQEAEAIKDTGIGFFHALTQLFFKGHAFLVALIDGFSPVEMGVAFVSIVALLVSLYMIFGHTKRMGKDWARIVMVISVIILFFLIIGSEVAI